MKIKQKGRIAQIEGGQILRDRLMSMGIYLGKEITKVGGFALRGPTSIKSGRSVIALGHGTAEKILVELHD